MTQTPIREEICTNKHVCKDTPDTGVPKLRRNLGGVIQVFTKNGLPTFTRDEEKARLLVPKRRGGIKNQP